MRRYFAAIFGLVNAYNRKFLRDKTALFFTFLFPVIFLLAFGSIFSGNSAMNFKVAMIDNSGTEFGRQFVEAGKKDDKTIKINGNITNLEQAKEMMSRSEIDSIIELTPGFGKTNTSQVPAGTMKVYYQKGSEQSGQTLAAVMQGILDDMNRRFGRPDAALKVDSVSTGKPGLSAFDYTFSGLLGFSILSMGIFGLANSMPQEKQRGSFRRLRASPFRSGQLLAAITLHYLLITLLSVLVMVLMGLFIYKFNMRGDWVTFGIFAALSSIMILGFGLVVGAWARNENQAAPLANILSFPMMFLSGVFFPRFLYPDWLQSITTYVPLTPVVDGFRQIMTENASLVVIMPQVGLVAAWTVVVYFLAFRLFRWE